MKKRIFIGIFLSKDLQNRIAKWQKDHKDLPVRFIPKEFLHYTLVPPWYEENIEEVVKLLQSAKPAGSFEIVFNKVTVGPEVKRPRLIWATGEMPPELLKLKVFLGELFKKKEKRPPLLHVTIARFNQKQFAKFLQKDFSENINWQDTINSFALIQSTLKKTGAEYKILAKIAL